MKNIWVALSLLVIVLVGATTLFIYTSTQYSDLQDNLDRMRQAVDREDWAIAQKEAAQLQKAWEKADASWTPIMDHRQVDRLDESLVRVIQLTAQQEKKDTLVEIAVAKRLLSRLKSTEVPDFRNVF